MPAPVTTIAMLGHRVGLLLNIPDPIWQTSGSKSRLKKVLDAFKDRLHVVGLNAVGRLKFREILATEPFCVLNTRVESLRYLVNHRR